jgi:hypothetical protein
VSLYIAEDYEGDDMLKPNINSYMEVVKKLA